MPDSALQPLASACGFSLLHEEKLDEIAGTAHVFRHESGARLLYLKNEDDNKGFSITFKTPATDDTGVFHILEHSVLCGSRDFPVKEPFVNLLKSSMQTFLNAMTFPDKTMYPVASTNERDLLNLMDVYLDAVFHPNIYTNRRIFEQEGWHFELEGADDGETETGEGEAAQEVHEANEANEADDAGDAAAQTTDAVAPHLAYNGVVYNEMKGALSDPESVLYDALSAALFPDTTYRFESGGTPEAIPTLTYDAFLDTHARHYHPANSYIVLYGNMNPEPFLKQINSYLRGATEGRPARVSVDAHPNPLCMQSPVVSEGVVKRMATAPENSCAALGFVAGDASQRERLVAVAVLVDAIMGSNEAPLKRALLDADIADDCDGFLSDSLLQPFVAITSRGLHGEDAAARLSEIVAKSARELADGALDIELVEAALSHAEFVMREGNFGYADGVIYSMSAMNGWLYDDSPKAATAYIRFEDVFASLRKKLSGDYFYKLLREIFVESDHHAQVEVKPVQDDEEAAERTHLKKLQSEMSPEELDFVAREARALKLAQTTPDSPEDLAKLPKLTRHDVGRPPEEPPYSVEEIDGMELLRHSVDTRGIAYAARFFDLSCVEADELPYVSVLALTLGRLNTESHTAAEIDTIVQGKLGTLSFSADVYDAVHVEDADASPVRAWEAKFAVAASALAENVDVAAELANEILTTTDFRDFGKIYDILVQRKVAMEQRFAMSGNSVASARAASYTFPTAGLRELMGGIDFYVFLKSLIDGFDERREELAEKLGELCARIFCDAGCMVSFAGPDEALACYSKLCPLGSEREGGGGGDGAHGGYPSSVLSAPKPHDLHEAFVVPADITYSALVADRFALLGREQITGSWLVAAKVLTYDYLWNEVRVVGGAYGVSFSTTRPGGTSFTSFRDPHVAETLDRFRASANWLSGFELSEDEFEGYVVSTAASFDKPMKARDLVRRQCNMHLSGNTRKEFLRHRSEVLEATEESVRELAPELGKLIDGACVCVVGGRDVIEAADTDLNVIDLLAL